MTVDYMLRVIRYGFTQRFNVSARQAYEWCTDYTPGDMALMQEENATREVKRVTDDTIVLTDTFVNESEKTIKQKLVCLYPSCFFWTSTHLTGPNKYSQFLYEITSQTDGQSCLTFTALHLDYNFKKEEDAERLAKELKKMDSENWKLLAKKMEKELKKR